jgi:LPXTG-motif cell wall-anchored protein
VRNLIRSFIALSVAALAFFALTSTAGAQSYTGATLTGSAQSVVSGGNITFTGTGFLPDADIELTVRSTPVVYNLTSDSSGSWSATVPAPTEPGPHTATATDGVNTVVFSFTVLGAAAGGGGGATPVPASTLPYTGGESGPFAQIGIGLLAVGALITILVRTRRTNNA